ncbi:MAG: hypothetical protein D3904_11255, partial [Candidatus Electrothrix sp. EH2]|nr:hypothetical protein [Candidatus Electrothrix sp. EH2]
PMSLSESAAVKPDKKHPTQGQTRGHDITSEKKICNPAGDDIFFACRYCFFCSTEQIIKVFLKVYLL